MEYTVLENDTLDDLVSEVNYLLKEGWELNGSFIAVTYINKMFFYQAMTKQKEGIIRC